MAGTAASQREVARLLGTTHVKIQRAARAGRIRPEPDGTWDVDRVRADLERSEDPARSHLSLPRVQPSRPPAPPAPRVQPPMREIPMAAVGAAADTLRENGIAPARPGGTTFADARTANEILKAQERRLRLDERKGKLIDKAKVLVLVHGLAKQERDAILAWPARVAAVLAAELGVDAHRLQTLLDSSLREHLADRTDVRLRLG
ncbi:elements of external origin [Roseococcus sp. SDR]|uniref:elements of external origin n=1 Tax=Roseococcus sp. SDR TaxID=2835532 RepID=UPI001BCF6E85|nr:elements of external origin [Roseococcus sp. SDR]MBS7790303.1 elements of external origin [Roseococcus sp. SDR]MBV1845617.1 elements of external origin [Roseococcus sp. SDR]